MKKSLVIHVALILCAIGGGYLLAVHLNNWQDRMDPSRKLVSSAPVGGFHKFASDIDWMLFINYLGSQKTVDNENVDEVTRRLSKLISYDPNMDQFYQVGVMSLCVQSPQQAVKFLKDATYNNKQLEDNWRIPFYAGFIIMHHYPKPNIPGKNPETELANEAVKYFEIALKRAGAEPEQYLINCYLRTKAQTHPSYDSNPRQAMLEILYKEWQDSVAAKNKGPGTTATMLTESATSLIPDLPARVLKAAQEAKSEAKDNDTKLLDLIKRVRKDILTGNLCDRCLAPYGAGEKFCASCGNGVEIYGICSNCKTVLKGKFCSVCGTAVPQKEQVLAPVEQPAAGAIPIAPPKKDDAVKDKKSDGKEVPATEKVKEQK